MSSPTSAQTTTVAQLQEATRAFDHLFTNEIVEAKEMFNANSDSPFHLIGLGVCVFLEAALGMEAAHMAEAARILGLADAASKKAMRNKEMWTKTRFTPGLEWEIMNADAVVLQGITHALSESYMGYLQCLYALNNAHSKFTKLYKAVYPAGLSGYSTPAASPSVSRKSSNPSLSSTSSEKPALKPKASSGNLSMIGKASFFGRWGASAPTPSSTLTVPGADENGALAIDGPVEDLILAGTAFGFGLFNLVFSLLPKKVQSLVGFFGFKHDRKLALQALAVSAAKKDVHSVFAGLVLMTYHGVVLLLSGYQADEAHIIKQYTAIVDSVEARYPNGSLWILNRAKILRMSGNPQAAIKVLQDGLSPEKKNLFVQADTLLMFELAWTLLAQRRYQEAATTFIRLTELNSWSHGTYYFIAAGCLVSVGGEENMKKAQEMFDKIPELIEKKKVGGKDLPTEVLIKKKLAFYNAKATRRGEDKAKLVECIKISPAEELGIFWNNQSRTEPSIAEAHIREWFALSPPVDIPSPFIQPSSSTTSSPPDLDTPDELALRLLLLGIAHRTYACSSSTSSTEVTPLASFEASRAFLEAAHSYHAQIVKEGISTWIGGVAQFELAVLDLKQAEFEERQKQTLEDGEPKKMWSEVLKKAKDRLDAALGLAGREVDLSSRLDSRIAMLKDEIVAKGDSLGVDVKV
ncbi:Mitochondrial outer membrane protein iml2 [Stygiomarasmius scandens]|uniref:Mitochondrial outer membrane protein iml2 n=1 Tax=Marasmiellus scandens TaxID=2682957 RepID=A0ABR1IZR6_9AGAR